VWEAGTLLDTRESAEARVADRGRLRATPGTQVRRDDGPTAHLTLTEGTVEVFVDAPARWLVVRIPGVDVVDLGCAYTVDVDAAGTGFVAVQTGAVRLEGDAPYTTLLAGTMAATWPDGHTGLAVRVGAPDALVAQVDAFDQRAGNLESLLAAAQMEDAITLWHLLSRVPTASRAQVLDRLEAVLGRPLPAERERVLQLDPDALDVALGVVIGQTL
jgi:hypothetical protein